MSRTTKILDHKAELEYGYKYVLPISRLLGVSVEGARHVPKKGHVVFFNNHGGWAALDWILLWPVIAKAIDEYFTGFSYPPLVKSPIVGHFLRRCGAVSIEKIDDIRFLKKFSRIYTIAPEGGDGSTKPFTQSYHLRPFRPGFIRLALKLRARLLPMTIVGNDDIFPVLFQTHRLQKLIGASFGFPISLLPLPISRIRAKIYPPIDLSQYDPDLADDALFCAKLAEKLRQDHQKRVDRDAKGQPFFKLSRFFEKILKGDEKEKFIWDATHHKDFFKAHI